MIIKGLQKLTLLDYPGMLAATVFVGGCNMRCPFCHNASLVLPDRFGASIPEDEVLAFLASRVGKLGGVCISGGEPTLQPDLSDFIRRVRDMGFAVKLDTNGLRPDVLAALVGEGLIDYIAMDVKNSLELYGATAGVPRLDTAPIVESIAIIRNSGLPHEFRTTLVRGLHTPKSVADIAELIGRDPCYFLQRFSDSGDLISDSFGGFDDEQIDKILAAARERIPTVSLRG